VCGVAGWIDWKEDLTQKRPILEAMKNSLSQRGPDAEGTWVSHHAALLHRRLVVVDPEGGGQPMVRQRGNRTYIISYNGELYNTNELRQELEVRGYTFRGYSDTEVLLASFIEWGRECVERLNGIFAFAVWDEAGQRLFLARDRLGVKPLFYAQQNSTFLFGSELKALLAHPLVKPEIDAEGLAEIFVMGPARTPGHGIFRGIKELKPGWSLVYDRGGIHMHQYWNLKSQPHLDDLETTTTRIRVLLEDTVERQLVSDVPVCVLLSGGVDSSAITAFAARAYERTGLGTLNTYSVDYVGNKQYFQSNQFERDSDAPWVQEVSGYFGTQHHYVEIDTTELVDALRAIVRARDLPGMVDVDASLYLFCKEIKKEATVAVSGESADEIFGGYPWFYCEDSLNCGAFPWIRMLRERMRLFSPALVAYMRPEEYVAERYREALAEVPRLPGEDPLEARMREMLYLNITRFMPILLDRKDRMSMAVGLEVRVPYCDHRLVEYAWNIPWRMKTCGRREKGILRRALKGLLPEEVLARRKSPYPKTHHPAYLEAVRARVREILSDSNSLLLPLLNVAAVREVVESGAREFNPAWFSQLMGGAQLLGYLVQLDMWLREYRVAIT
jgi:asparagine synthase (glutamine-hydrolysing)